MSNEEPMRLLKNSLLRLTLRKQKSAQRLEKADKVNHILAVLKRRRDGDS